MFNWGISSNRKRIRLRIIVWMELKYKEFIRTLYEFRWVFIILGKRRWYFLKIMYNLIANKRNFK
jgi:hypothetical protein